MAPGKLLLPLIVCALAAAAPARAEDPVVYGPDGAPTVVQRKLYRMTGRVEVGLAGELSLNTALVNHYGGILGISIHPNEWLDLGVDLMGNFTGPSRLAKNIRGDLAFDRAGVVKDEFANDNQLRGGLFGTARLAPIYGKLNLASELSVHFQAFVLGGAGVGSVHRESVNLCATPGTTPVASCGAFQTEDNFPAIGELGLGLRFYLGETWSLRTEVRGFFFRSTYKKDNTLSDPATGRAHAYLAAVAMLVAGLSRTF